MKDHDWMSVDLLLPDEGPRVLVFIPDTDTRFDTDRIVDGRWVRWSGHITHWMPIPDAPEMIKKIK